MAEIPPTNKYAREFSEESFWQKIRTCAVIAGKQVIEKVLTLYYCMLDSDTPLWAKGVILGALGYFILPTDAIPDVIAAVGYSDDLGALASALAIVGVHTKPEHQEKAKEKLKQWFGDDTSEVECE